MSRTLAAEVFRCNALTLTDYERGKRGIPYQLVRVMAWGYDVPIDWIVDGVGEVPCQPPSAAARYFQGVDSSAPERWLRERMRHPPWRPQLPAVSDQGE